MAYKNIETLRQKQASTNLSSYNLFILHEDAIFHVITLHLNRSVGKGVCNGTEYVWMIDQFDKYINETRIVDHW